jgi:hypothetical protein
MFLKKLSVCIWILIAAIFILRSDIESAETKTEKFSLSVPNLKVEKDDRIAQFKVTILQGFVVSIPRIPPGWFMAIDLPFQWKTVATAGIVVGVAALPKGDIKYFDDFLIVETLARQEYPLSVEVEIMTLNEKHYVFKMNELILRKIEQ